MKTQEDTASLNWVFMALTSNERGESSSLDLAGVEDSAPPSGDPAAEEAELVQVAPGVDLGGGDFGQDGVLGERAAAHEVVERDPVLGEARRPVRHDSSALGGSDHRTEVGLGGGAEDAVLILALRSVAGDDHVPRLHAGHALPHALHHGCRLVAQHAGEQTLGVVAVLGVREVYSK